MKQMKKPKKKKQIVKILKNKRRKKEKKISRIKERMSLKKAQKTIMKKLIQHQRMSRLSVTRKLQKKMAKITP